MSEYVLPEFVARMESEFRANSHKGDWRKWEPTRGVAIRELKHHVEKLRMALDRIDPESVSEYSADVANIAMKVFECHGHHPLT